MPSLEALLLKLLDFVVGDDLNLLVFVDLLAMISVAWRFWRDR